MGKFSNAISSIPQSSIKEQEANFQLQILQQPLRARACGYSSKFTGRRIVDPPPVIKISLFNSDGDEMINHSLGMFILTAELIKVESNTEDLLTSRDGSYATNQNLIHALRKKQQQQQLSQSNISNLFGSTSVSATITNNNNSTNNNELKAFFVFGDLSIRFEGLYKFKFTLYEYSIFNRSKLVRRNSIFTDSFQAYSAKDFPGLASSPLLIRQVSELGCRVRVRNISGCDNKIKKLKIIKKNDSLSNKNGSSFTYKNINKLTLSKLPLLPSNNVGYTNYNNLESSDCHPKSSSSDDFFSATGYSSNTFQSPISDNISPLMENFNHESMLITNQTQNGQPLLQTQQYIFGPSQNMHAFSQENSEVELQRQPYESECHGISNEYNAPEMISHQLINGHVPTDQFNEYQMSNYYQQFLSSNINEAVSVSSSPASPSFFHSNQFQYNTSTLVPKEGSFEPTSQYGIEQHYNMFGNFTPDYPVGDKSDHLNMMMILMAQGYSNYNNNFMNQNLSWINPNSNTTSTALVNTNDNLNNIGVMANNCGFYNLNQ